VAVVDRLGAALEEILGRSLQPSVLRDGDKVVRLIAQRSDVQGLTEAAFDAIRQAAREIPTVLIRLADVLGQLAPALPSRESQDAVVRELGKLAETAGDARLASCDRQAVLARIEQARIAVTSRPREGTIHVL
jgi:uncharacterized membrane protein